MVLTILLDLSLALSLVVTNPTKLGPLGVTFWFVLVLAALTATLATLLYYIKIRFRPDGVARRQLGTSVRQGFLVAFGAVAMLALRSLRQLSLRDIVLIVLIISLVEFYRRTPK